MAFVPSSCRLLPGLDREGRRIMRGGRPARRPRAGEASPVRQRPPCLPFRPAAPSATTTRDPAAHIMAAMSVARNRVFTGWAMPTASAAQSASTASGMLGTSRVTTSPRATPSSRNKRAMRCRRARNAPWVRRIGSDSIDGREVIAVDSGARADAGDQADEWAWRRTWRRLRMRRSWLVP